jgi:hypothetical protein
MEQPLSAEPTLLIVTDRQDFTADFVIVRLLERGLSYYRLNSDQLAASTMTLRVGGGRRPQRVIACGGASIDLEHVQCVWYRRAVRPAAPESIEPGLRPFAASELRHLYEGLICDPDIRWVNPPEATDRAERKVYQLRIAEKHGLRVPSTIVSTDIEGIANFADREGPVICKPISQGLISSGEGAYAVHTHGVTHRVERSGANPALASCRFGYFLEPLRSCFTNIYGTAIASASVPGYVSPTEMEDCTFRRFPRGE